MHGTDGGLVTVRGRLQPFIVRMETLNSARHLY